MNRVERKCRNYGYDGRMKLLILARFKEKNQFFERR